MPGEFYSNGAVVGDENFVDVQGDESIISAVVKLQDNLFALFGFSFSRWHA